MCHERGVIRVFCGEDFLKLRQDILDGKYKARDSLVELKLAEEMGVNRTPVREAIRQLELEGLVFSIPNKGVFVEGSQARILRIYTYTGMHGRLGGPVSSERMDVNPSRSWKIYAS